MKKSILIVIILLPFLSIGQNITCDTATIFGTDGTNAFCFEVVSNVRYCFSNNYPDHSDNYTQAQFTLEEDDEEYSMCAYPDTNSWFTPLYEAVETSSGCTDTYIFGVLINGVRIDPSSGDVFENSDGTNNIEWHIEASSTATTTGNNMGTLNGGHLNPFGDYHYHTVPTDYFVNDLGIDGTAHSPIVGYAADGFPIYYKYVYQNSTDTNSSIISVSSGYSLKSGTRPGDGLTAPDGSYDGEYYEDYEYTTTLLDSCNGRYAVTPDYPYGTYYYVWTDNYPNIPRCFKGTELDPTYRVGRSAACPSSTASTDCAAAVSGCLDPFANNYNANANLDDGTCTYTAMPVELISFTAKKQGENVLLNWQTASELNNLAFEIEWSVDGDRFFKIGQLNGGGTTLEIQYYQFIHELERNTFSVTPKNYYYRLKQIDTNGMFEYSMIKVIKFEKENVSTAILPNPATDFITIKEGIIGQTVQVFTTSGQIIKTFGIKSKVHNQSVQELPNGIYFIKIGDIMKKLIVN